MKSILIAITLLSITNLASAKERILYSIVQGYHDHTIGEDSIYVTGKIAYETSPALDNFGKVSSLDFLVAKIVGRSGDYSLKMHKKAKGFYFFQEGYQEVVVDLSAFPESNRFEVNIIGKRYFELIQTEKPVIYLYSATPIKTELTLSPIGDLTFTYPNYENKWEVETQENGNILNLSTGKSHPYLFWEADQPSASFQAEGKKIEGYIIQTDSTVRFLENELSNLGLNSKESTDFITYWAPRIMAKQFATIQFLVDDKYHAFFGGIESTAPLDYQLRIGILFKVSDHEPPLNVVAPNIKKPEKRHGFSLIEWGGAELKTALIPL